jgi:hypothetical protein
MGNAGQSQQGCSSNPTMDQGTNFEILLMLFRGHHNPPWCFETDGPRETNTMAANEKVPALIPPGFGSAHDQTHFEVLLVLLQFVET